MAVFLAFLLLVSSFSPYLLIAPAFSQVKAQEVIEVISPAPTAELTLTPAETPIPTPTIEVTPTSEPTVTPEPTPTQTPTPSQWTFENVELNKEYVAPQNSEVKLTFTKLPDPSGNIKIEEITLTQEQVEQTGSLSDKAYDITSDMKDGEFTYNLSLPIPESSKGKAVEVKFAEELSNIASATKVENNLTTTDTSVSVTDLNHFTIFVVSVPALTGDVCLTATGGTSTCYATIQEAIDASVDGDIINLTANISGITETVVVNKAVTINGGGFTLSFTGLEADGGLPGVDDGLTIQDVATINNLTVDAGLTTPSAWDGTYAIQVYHTTATLNNVTAKNGNGGILNNNSTVTLTGAINVSDNGMGGIESSGANASLNVADVSWTNSSEVYGLPTIWEDGLTGDTVINYGAFTRITKGGQYQYYLTASNGTTINVPANYSTIQAAVNAANSGDTINVAAGAYNESQILINKPLTLQGAGYATTIIDGGGTSTGGLVKITASSGTVTLSGFTIQNTNNSDDLGHGINVDNGGVSSVDVKILNNAIKNVGPVGIRINTATSVQIERNIISSLYSSTAVIPNGIQIGNLDGDGNALSLGITGTIKDNEISGSSWVDYNASLGYEGSTTSAGILIMDTTAALEISNNNIHNNNVGIDIEAGSSTTIENNDIYDNAYGVVLWNQNPSINNNKIENNSTEGVFRTTLGSPLGTVNATNNWWGSSDPTIIQAGISDNVTFRPYYTDSNKTILSPTAPGTPTTDSTSPTSNTTPTWNWTSSIDAAHYIFYWSTDLGGITFNSGNISGTSYTHTNPLDDFIWYTKVLAYDSDGNSSPFSDNSSPLTVDKTNPTGTIVINGGAAYTNAIDHEVTLTLGAGADLSGVTEMAFSNGSTYSTWEAYSISKLWNVSAGDGSKTVRVKFKDAAGNETSPGIPATITVDTAEPVITLNGVTSNIEVGGTYEELGATANDGSIVSITGSVNTAVVDSYTITYNATDVAGNHAISVTRTVNVVDTIIPVITRVGSDTVTLEIHNTYTDAGVTASDNYDGDLTGSIEMDDSNIDNTTVGSYIVTYSVTDANGNEAEEITRTVNVVDSIDSAFNTISSSLAGDGIASNIGNVTTDNIQNFSGLYFEKSIDGNKVGKITFTAGLDLSDPDTQDFLQNLGDYMEANPGSMSFDATTEAGMKAAGAEIRMYGINALGYYNVASIIVKDDDGNILSEGDEDYPDLTGISYASTDGGTLIFTTEHFTQFELDQNQTTPNIDGDATLSGDTTQVVLTDETQNVTVEIASGTVNPTIDVSAFVSDNGEGGVEGILPKITINSDVADVVIPDNTEVTGPSGWDGVIDAPTEGTPAGGNAPAGFSVGSTVISIGSDAGTLFFDTPVTIILPNVTGTVGYRPAGSNTWQTITNVCADPYATPGNPPAGSECAISNGTDTKIVTYHFTSFGNLTANQSSSGGVGTTTASAPVCNDTKPGSAPTLLSAIAGFNSVTLTWSKAVDPVSYYLMTFGTSAGSQTYGNPNVGGKDTTSYTVNGLSGGATYYFRVRAGNGCAPGDFSNELSAAPTGGFIEGIPVGFEAGVLGEATKSEEPTEESTPGAQGTALGAETKNGVINSWWWPWILLSLLPLGWVVYHYKKPRP